MGDYILTDVTPIKTCDKFHNLERIGDAVLQLALVELLPNDWGRQTNVASNKVLCKGYSKVPRNFIKGMDYSLFCVKNPLSLEKKAADIVEAYIGYLYKNKTYEDVIAFVSKYLIDLE